MYEDLPNSNDFFLNRNLKLIVKLFEIVFTDLKYSSFFHLIEDQPYAV